MNRVLIIKMWALGDLLMATPMLAALKARNAGVRISWLVESAHAPILENHPLIDDLILLDSGAWRRKLRRGNLLGWVRQTVNLRRALHARRFDAALNCQANKSWSRLLCAAPVRIGLFESESLPGAGFYTHAISRPKTPQVHNIDHYLRATQALGCPGADRRLTIGETADEAAFWADFCRRERIDRSKPIIIFAPFATGENRCWEPERWAELARRIRSDAANAQIVLASGPRDEEAAREIQTRCAANGGIEILLAGRTSIRQYVSLIRNADLIVCVDSSALHIAAAVGTPFVTIFGPTPITERVPLVGRGLPVVNLQNLACAPCDQPHCTHATFRQCMKQVEVGAVFSVVERLLFPARTTR